MLVDSKPCSITVDGVRVEIERRIILRDVSFKAEGGIIALIGPNGAGKTTLLRVIAGIIKPSTGIVRICDVSPGDARKFISYVPAFLQSDPYARVEDIIEAYIYDVRVKVKTEEVLKVLGLEGLRGRRFNSLSGGEHKLVLLAGALARRPRVLLLDEPFSHLDLANQAKLARILLEASRNIAVVMAVHEPLHASLAEKIGIVNAGELIAFGSPKEVLRKDILEKVYGVKLEEVYLGARQVIVPDFTYQSS